MTPQTPKPKSPDDKNKDNEMPDDKKNVPQPPENPAEKPPMYLNSGTAAVY